jgi:hypothetical protein
MNICEGCVYYNHSYSHVFGHVEFCESSLTTTDHFMDVQDGVKKCEHSESYNE